MTTPRHYRLRRACECLPCRTLAGFRSPTEAQFVAALHADGYDAATDRGGSVPASARFLPGWMILALRPRFAFAAGHPAWRRGIRAWRKGFRLGLEERR